MVEPAERQELLELNLRAGQEAREFIAFRAAWDYFTTALKLLPEDSWRSRYAVALSLYESLVEAAYLNGDFEAMDEFAGTAIKEAHGPLDLIRIFEVRSQALAAQTKLVESVRAGLQILESLGVSFPERPAENDINAALRETQSTYQGKDVEELADLRLMTDPHQLAIMRILASISSAAFESSPNLFYLFALKQVALSVQYGNTAASALGYAAYAYLLCGKMADIELGCKFGQLALDLVQRMNAKEWHCRVHSFVHFLVLPWKKPIKDLLTPFRSAYHSGLEVGDFQNAASSGFHYCSVAYFAGIEKELSEIQQEAASLRESARQTKQMQAVYRYQILQQAIHDLRESRASSKYLKGEFYDEEVMLPLHLKANDRPCIFMVYFHRLLLNYLLGEYEQAIEDASKLLQFTGRGRRFLYDPIFYMYDSLTRLAINRKNHQAEADDALRKIEANQEIVKTWAQYSPASCLHKYQLVEAERYRNLGDKVRAIEEYDLAIEGAKENGCLREEALANELAAEFFLDMGQEKVAQGYMEEARDCYARWGANAKVARFFSSFPVRSFSVAQYHDPPFYPDRFSLGYLLVNHA